MVKRGVLLEGVKLNNENLMQVLIRGQSSGIKGLKYIIEFNKNSYRIYYTDDKKTQINYSL